MLCSMLPLSLLSMLNLSMLCSMLPLSLLSSHHQVCMAGCHLLVWQMSFSLAVVVWHLVHRAFAGVCKDLFPLVDGPSSIHVLLWPNNLLLLLEYSWDVLFSCWCICWLSQHYCCCCLVNWLLVRMSRCSRCAWLYLIWSVWICSCGCWPCYCWPWWIEVRFDFEPCFSCPRLSIQCPPCLCWQQTVKLLLKILLFHLSIGTGHVACRCLLCSLALAVVRPNVIVARNPLGSCWSHCYWWDCCLDTLMCLYNVQWCVDWCACCLHCQIIQTVLASMLL